jgi:hypothetical protein
MNFFRYKNLTATEKCPDCNEYGLVWALHSSKCFCIGCISGGCDGEISNESPKYLTPESAIYSWDERVKLFLLKNKICESFLIY